MQHIEVPVQAGDDEVLGHMKRGYTSDDYRRLVERIRPHDPHASIATDIIVGFPGETEEQFQRTYDLLGELKLDVAHLARYSPGPARWPNAACRMMCPKTRRCAASACLTNSRKILSGRFMRRYFGRTVEVLFEEKVAERWQGRTRTNKLVFATSSEDLRGQVRPVKIDWTGPWSMIGSLV